eukprot:TRINITY_DN41491_c0_g1_i1.p1 TRINITY_DN41491_c0_g1~~TRINITY_DN41491_c0_g1_i1.p1  ORF type:complete len:116 (-),score=29.55 TRINITY_DN41491_c0_g1_i1:25-372(-)
MVAASEHWKSFAEVLSLESSSAGCMLTVKQLEAGKHRAALREESEVASNTALLQKAVSNRQPALAEKTSKARPQKLESDIEELRRKLEERGASKRRADCAELGLEPQRAHRARCR